MTALGQVGPCSQLVLWISNELSTSPAARRPLWRPFLLVSKHVGWSGPPWHGFFAHAAHTSAWAQKRCPPYDFHLLQLSVADRQFFIHIPLAEQRTMLACLHFQLLLVDDLAAATRRSHGRRWPKKISLENRSARCRAASSFLRQGRHGGVPRLRRRPCVRQQRSCGLAFSGLGL